MMHDHLARLVPVEAHRAAHRALRTERFALLIGRPGSGKSSIAASLAIGAMDLYDARPVKLSRIEELHDRWNPREPDQFFWLDDAFGPTQYEYTTADAWNRATPSIAAALRGGARLVVTSRDYVYAAAREELKLSAFPLLEEATVVIEVESVIHAENITTTTYDAASHTKRVAESDGSYVDYAYDALGRLVRRVEHWPGESDVTTLFFHDGGSATLVLETTGAGAVLTRYVLDSDGRPVGDDEVADNLGRAYYVTDPRGDLTQLVGHDQGVKAVFAYDSFGKAKDVLSAAVGSWDSRLRFQLAPEDPKTGAYALGPRMYDPSINRFVGADHYVGAAANLALQTDPLTGNRYLYAGANPANLIDDGHSPRRASQTRYFAPTSWDIITIWSAYVSLNFDYRLLHAGNGANFYNNSTVTPSVGLIEARVFGQFRSRPCPSCWDKVSAAYNAEIQGAYRQAIKAGNNIAKLALRWLHQQAARRLGRLRFRCHEVDHRLDRSLSRHRKGNCYHSWHWSSYLRHR